MWRARAAAGASTVCPAARAPIHAAPIRPRLNPIPSRRNRRRAHEEVQMVKKTSLMFAAVFVASVLLAPVASAQHGVHAEPIRPMEPMPRVEPMPRIEPMPDYSPPQDYRDLPTIPVPPPARAEALCSDEEALAGRCTVVSRLPRCPGDPRCPDPASLNSRS
ncbi:MAG TPA: hypothetical protein DHW63_12735 [Hyphomonadaceae bacterium]|nr:hypothetical protein [Hyphomonadaceae bacterium]